MPPLPPEEPLIVILQTVFGPKDTAHVPCTGTAQTSQARDSEYADNIQTPCVQLKGFIASCPRLSHGPCAPWTHLLRTLRHPPPIRLRALSASLPGPSPPVSVPHGSLPPSLLSRQSFRENARHTLALRFFPHAFFPLLVAPCLTKTLNMGHQLTKTINRGHPLFAGPSMAAIAYLNITV